MSFEWPTPSERKRNLAAYRRALALSKCKFTEDDLELHRSIMALPPSERLARAVRMMLPRDSRLVRDDLFRKDLVKFKKGRISLKDLLDIHVLKNMRP